MDVLYFLKERTGFIGRFYQTASVAFRERMRKIETGEPPFDPTPSCGYYEYDEEPFPEEPPFLEEWLESDTALQLLGLACLSMLSESLKLYFHTWERELGIRWPNNETRKKAFEKGFLSAYKRCFEEVLNLSWDACPANLVLIGQVTLARNRAQHPDDIGSMRIYYAPTESRPLKTVFFIRDEERNPDMLDVTWMNPEVHVSPDMLGKAIEQVEILTEWLEKHMQEARWKRMRDGRAT
jgi:hypothetical protein